MKQNITALNFKEKDKKFITEEKAHRYTYYEFTEEKIRKIIKQNVNEVSNDDWRALIQMLYPKCLIASGLFQPILIFKIKNGYRVDPPMLAFDSITDRTQKNSKSLFEMIIDHLEKNGLTFKDFDDSWYKVLTIITGDKKMKTKENQHND